MYILLPDHGIQPDHDVDEILACLGFKSAKNLLIVVLLVGG
jgi:hypothetical protein